MSLYVLVGMTLCNCFSTRIPYVITCLDMSLPQHPMSPSLVSAPRLAWPIEKMDLGTSGNPLKLGGSNSQVSNVDVPNDFLIDQLSEMTNIVAGHSLLTALSYHHDHRDHHP